MSRVAVLRPLVVMLALAALGAMAVVPRNSYSAGQDELKQKAEETKDQVTQKAEETKDEAQKKADEAKAQAQKQADDAKAQAQKQADDAKKGGGCCG